jgi:hypothetical protein
MPVGFPKPEKVGDATEWMANLTRKGVHLRAVHGRMRATEASTTRPTCTGWDVFLLVCLKRNWRTRYEMRPVFIVS